MHRAYATRKDGYVRSSDDKTFIECKWTCSNCRIQGGMSLCIDHCPECLHLRCSDCPKEYVERKDVERISHVDRVYARSVDASYKRSPHRHQVQPMSPLKTTIDTALSKIRVERKEIVSDHGIILNSKTLQTDSATPDPRKPYEPSAITSTSTSTACGEEYSTTTSIKTLYTDIGSLEHRSFLPKPFKAISSPL